MTLPVWIIPAGCQSQITLVQCRGAKSHVYDMYTGQGVVSSRAVFVYCDLLRLSSDRVFCLPISITYFNRLILNIEFFRPPPLLWSSRKQPYSLSISNYSHFIGTVLVMFMFGNEVLQNHSGLSIYLLYECNIVGNCLRM